MLMSEKNDKMTNRVLSMLIRRHSKVASMASSPADRIKSPWPWTLAKGCQLRERRGKKRDEPEQVHQSQNLSALTTNL
ncbi:hypothetical protein SCLCIDRAFT_661702 [Scleroderma citrinum Foug A]|uniref:Uncharacterized protein n=1 Tax=Scleroderma citrinum Foug A TaxID=1036808 RepID=A0A0C3AH01_9AGAM|nr:hypothetical protein SCLCIDRAFT_661702 [Scleroderma citrinum Foug A]